jgi:hypothetical protein
MPRDSKQDRRMAKINIARWTAVALFVVVTAGCGGGGGGGGGDDGGGRTSTSSYTISLTTPTLNFSGAELETIAPQAVGTTFNGAGVIVGTLPGQTLPSWLVLDAYNQSSPTQISFPIRVVTANVAPGTYSTTLRFVTGDANGNSLAFVDLAVTLTLREGFKVTLAPGTLLEFSGVESGATAVTPQAGYTAQVRGENISWSVGPTPTWLRVTPSSGTAAGVVTITAVTAGLPAGQQVGSIGFHDSSSNRSWTLSAHLQIGYPALSITPTDTNYSVDNSTDATGTQGSFVISDTAQGQNATRYFNWTADFLYPNTVRTTPYPLIASPTSGSTFGTATSVSLNLDTHVLNGLPSGNYTLPVRINMSPPPPTCCAETTFVNAEVTVRLPRLGTAVPYQIPANAASTIRLIGEDLRDEDLPRLLLDGQPLPPSYTATRLSSQEIELAMPGQSAGQHTITFSNTLGLPRSAVELLVYTPTSVEPTGADLPGTGKRVQLVYDDVRARLYAVDLDVELERYEWNGTSWSDLGALPAPGIRAAAKLRDGRRLAISSSAGMSTLNLNSPNALTLLTDATFLTCGGGSYPLNELAIGEAGSVFMTVWGNSCSPYGHIMEYDLLNDSHDDPRGATYYGASMLFYPGALVAASGDGRYVAMSAIGHSGMDYALLDLRTRTYVVPKTELMAGRQMQLDTAGTKVLLHAFPDTVIRDRAGMIQGKLPANQGARISPDGTRALIHVHGANGTGFLQLYDISVAVGQAATFPTVGAPIPVPFDMGTLDIHSVPNSYVSNFGLEWSADSEIAFVSGSTRIVAIRLP